MPGFSKASAKCSSSFSTNKQLRNSISNSELNKNFVDMLWSLDVNKSSLEPIYQLGLRATTLSLPELHPSLSAYQSRAKEFEHLHQKIFSLESEKDFPGYSSILRFAQAADSLTVILEKERIHSPGPNLKIQDFAYGVAIELAINAVIEALRELNQYLTICQAMAKCDLFLFDLENQMATFVGEDRLLKHHATNLILKSYMSLAFKDQKFSNKKTLGLEQTHFGFFSFVNSIFFLLHDVQVDLPSLARGSFLKKDEAPVDYLLGAASKLGMLVDAWSQTVFLTHKTLHSDRGDAESKILLPTTRNETKKLLDQEKSLEATIDIANVVQGFVLMNQDVRRITDKQIVDLHRIIVWFNTHLSCLEQVEDEVYKSVHLKLLSRVWYRYLEPVVIEHSRDPHAMGAMSFFTVPLQHRRSSIDTEMQVYIEQISEFFK